MASVSNHTTSFFHKGLPVIAWFTAVLFLTSCENDEKDIAALSSKKIMIDEARNIESYMSQEGAMKARLTAPLMLRVSATDSPYTEFPKSLHVDFFNDKDSVETRLDSRYGKYFENKNKVYLRDSIIMISVKGDTLKCEDLWWDQDKGLFYTEKYAQYHTSDQRIYGGKGLEATDDLKSVTFKEPTGTVNVSSSGLPQH